MEYKIIISNEGEVITDVINRGKHKCNDIIHVAQGFGKVIDKKKKDDTQPVHERINVRGN